MYKLPDLYKPTSFRSSNCDTSIGHQDHGYTYYAKFENSQPFRRRNECPHPKNAPEQSRHIYTQLTMYVQRTTSVLSGVRRATCNQPVPKRQISGCSVSKRKRWTIGFTNRCRRGRDGRSTPPQDTRQTSERERYTNWLRIGQDRKRKSVCVFVRTNGRIPQRQRAAENGRIEKSCNRTTLLTKKTSI